VEKIRVLVIDDSVVFRSQIKAALELLPWIEVVGVAANGKIGLDKIRSMKVDLVTLDLEMPEMDGLTMLREMKKQQLAAKILVFSAVTPAGASQTFEALDSGAIDFIAKPGPHAASDPNLSAAQNLQKLLLPKLEALFKAPGKLDPLPIPAPAQSKKPFAWSNFHPRALLIGCSTGGPNALEKIFNGLQGPFQIPVFIIQHMPPVFTASLAGRIEKLTGVRAREAVHNEIVQNSAIYVAPGNFHMQLSSAGTDLVIKLNQEEQENSVRPAVDQTFRSAAKIYQGDCLSFILTGMGKDGLDGARSLRSARNPVIIQSRESCVVFGMPGALFEHNEFDDIQDLEQIQSTIAKYLGCRRIMGVAS
jgi:two-component system chemotaxis response regulator CheB